MYWRSAAAIVKNPPPKSVCFIECQFGEAKYYEGVSGCITTRIDAGGCWFVQVEAKEPKETQPVIVLGSLQDHAVINRIGGGNSVCPCKGGLCTKLLSSYRLVDDYKVIQASYARGVVV